MQGLAWFYNPHNDFSAESCKYYVYFTQGQSSSTDIETFRLDVIMQHDVAFFFFFLQIPAISLQKTSHKSLNISLQFLKTPTSKSRIFAHSNHKKLNNGSICWTPTLPDLPSTYHWTPGDFFVMYFKGQRVSGIIQMVYTLYTPRQS